MPGALTITELCNRVRFCVRALPEDRDQEQCNKVILAAALRLESQERLIAQMRTHNSNADEIARLLQEANSYRPDAIRWNAIKATLKVAPDGTIYINEQILCEDMADTGKRFDDAIDRHFASQ